MNCFGGYVNLLTRDGDLLHPAFPFFSEPQTGSYLDTSVSPPDFVFLKNGTKIMLIKAGMIDIIGDLNVSGTITGGGLVPTTISLEDGKVATPSLNFINDTDTGIFRKYPGGIGISGNGGELISFDTVQIATTKPIVTTQSLQGDFYVKGSDFVADTGLGGGYSFNGDSDTKIYDSAIGDNLKFQVNGNIRLDISDSDIMTTVPITTTSFVQTDQVFSGDPGYVFKNENNTGLQYDSKTLILHLRNQGVDGLHVKNNGVSSELPFTCGTNSLTAGAMSCSSLSSTGNISQPRYWTRLSMASPFEVKANTWTFVNWDTIDTNTNFSVTVPTTTLTIPTNGVYLLQYHLIYETKNSSFRIGAIEINSATPGSTRRYAETDQWNSGSIDQTGFGNSVILALTAGDTAKVATFQQTGDDIDIYGLGLQISTFSAYRLSE